MKYPGILFVFVAVLGIVLVSILLTALYSDVIGLDNMLTSLPTMPIFWISMLGGTILLTVGIIGIGRQFFEDENKRRLFTFYAIIIIPSVILILINYISSMQPPMLY